MGRPSQKKWKRIFFKFNHRRGACPNTSSIRHQYGLVVKTFASCGKIFLWLGFQNLCGQKQCCGSGSKGSASFCRIQLHNFFAWLRIRIQTELSTFHQSSPPPSLYSTSVPPSPHLPHSSSYIPQLFSLTPLPSSLIPQHCSLSSPSSSLTFPPSSLIPHPFSLISHPYTTSLLPHSSPFFPHINSLTPTPPPLSLISHLSSLTPSP